MIVQYRMRRLSRIDTLIALFVVLFVDMRRMRAFTSLAHARVKGSLAYY